MMQSFHITSIKDARVVEARELTSVAGRARFQKTQLEGEESIQWALEALQIRCDVGNVNVPGTDELSEEREVFSKVWMGAMRPRGL